MKTQDQTQSEKQPAISLDMAEIGLYTCVQLLAIRDVEIRLKNMGVCVGRRIRVLASGDPIVVLVSGTQIGLSKSVAKQVMLVGASDCDNCRPVAPHSATKTEGL